MKFGNLGQKDAIFEVIKGELGDTFQPGVNVRDILQPGEHNRIQRAIFEGLKSGRIPTSKLKGKSEAYLNSYANRIMNYWLRKDSRLNGGIKAKGRPKNPLDRYKRLVATDAQIKALKDLRELKVKRGLQGEVIEIEKFLRHRHFDLFLAAYRIESLPDDVLEDLGLSLPRRERSSSV